jgi:hypothetical protein
VGQKMPVNGKNRSNSAKNGKQIEAGKETVKF